TAQTVAQINRQYGLNRPFYAGYWAYLKSISRFDFGTSINTRRPVLDEIGTRFPATVELAVSAMIFAVVFGIPLGFVAAKRYGGAVDHLSLVASLLGISIPIFFLAIILKYIFAVKLGWLPSIGRQDVLIFIKHPTNFYVLDALIAWDWSAVW